MGSVCSGKRPQSSDIEDTEPAPIRKGSRVSSPVDAQCIEVDDMRSNFVQVEDQVAETKTVVLIAGERKHKLPDKYPEEKEKKKQKKQPTPAVTTITTAVDADPTRIQIEDTLPNKRTPVSSSPKSFAADFKADLEASKKKRGPETRERPPSIPIPSETEQSSIQDENSRPNSARSDPPSSKPTSTKSDISEYDSVGEMFAAENEDTKAAETTITPFNSPQLPDEVPVQVLEPDETGEKLADLFADVGDDNTAMLFTEEAEAAVPVKNEEQEEEVVAVPVESGKEIEPVPVVKEKEEVQERLDTVASEPAEVEEDDVFEFDEPDQTEEEEVEGVLVEKEKDTEPVLVKKEEEETEPVPVENEKEEVQVRLQMAASKPDQTEI